MLLSQIGAQRGAAENKNKNKNFYGGFCWGYKNSNLTVLTTNFINEK